MGLPGSGKSYFANALTEKIGGVYLNSDIIRDQLGLRGQYDQVSKNLVYQALLDRSKAHLTTGKTVIVDSTFYLEKLRRDFLDIARQLDIPSRIINIKAAEATIRKRLQKKRTYSEADWEVYQKIKNAFEVSDHSGLVLYSDQLSLAEMVNQAIAYLNL